MNEKESAPMWPIMVEPKENGTDREKSEWRKEKRDPAFYRIEYRAQFGDSSYSYFDADKVKACFNYGLKERKSGLPGVEYKIHCDPGRVNDYFSAMVCHVEGDAVVEDRAMVWRPEDKPDHTLNYLEIETALEDMARSFRPSQITFDQFNSAFMIDSLRAFTQRFAMSTEVAEETATHLKNVQMFENLKLLINEGRVRCYADNLNTQERGRSLLEASLCKVEDEAGKIVKPREEGFGHLDLADCLAVLCYQFSDALSTGGGYDYNDLTGASLASGYEEAEWL